MGVKIARISGIIVGIILLLFGAMNAYSKMYYSERDQIRARLEAIPNIESIEIFGRDKLFQFYVRAARIRLVDHPDSIIELEAPALGILKDSDHILLSQLGRWIFSSRKLRTPEIIYDENGKPIQSVPDYAYGSIDVGSAGPVTDRIPFKIKNIQDLISHYTELENFFDTLPERSDKGDLIKSGDNKIFYRIPEGSR
jgi:hypothetical protein